LFMPMPKRMRSTRSSRGVTEASTRVVDRPKIAAISASQRLSNVIPAEILALGPSCISQRPQLKRE
jgi:hypothetical protein